MSVQGKRKRSKDTFIRNKVKREMLENLRQGKTYGVNFSHLTKAKLKEMKQPSRYSK